MTVFRFNYFYDNLFITLALANILQNCEQRFALESVALFRVLIKIHEHVCFVQNYIYCAVVIIHFSGVTKFQRTVNTNRVGRTITVLWNIKQNCRLISFLFLRSEAGFTLFASFPLSVFSLFLCRIVNRNYTIPIR